jgi:RNA polymerase sigma-70 factor (ECF subfamily)
LWSDGGGKAPAALKPILGATKVARFIGGALRKFVPATRDLETAEINSQPGIVTYVGRRPISAVILDVVDDRIQTIYIVANPEKLARLPHRSQPTSKAVPGEKPTGGLDSIQVCEAHEPNFEKRTRSR